MLINAGLLPATIFVLNDFAMDTGQLTPKHINIIASNILIILKYMYRMPYFQYECVYNFKIAVVING